MSIEINTVIIGGNLAKDVVVKEIGSGNKVAALVVASNRTYLNNGQKVKETAFIDVDVWGAQADNCGKFLAKGSPVVVTGRLKQEQWQTQNGEKRNRLKIIASNIQFLPSRQRREGMPDPLSDQNIDTAWEG